MKLSLGRRSSLALLIPTLFFTFTSPRAESPEAELDSGNLRTVLELVRKDVRTDKALILAAQMDFTEDEAVSFWPAYNEYELDLSKWYDKRFALLRKYLEQEQNLSEESAAKLASAAFKMEEDRTALKRKYFKKFTKIIGVKKSARFFQVENQLNAAIDLRIAAALPLIK